MAGFGRGCPCLFPCQAFAYALMDRPGPATGEGAPPRTSGTPSPSRAAAAGKAPAGAGGRLPGAAAVRKMEDGFRHGCRGVKLAPNVHQFGFGEPVLAEVAAACG